MESSQLKKTCKRRKRSVRVRQHLRGSSERPRLSVYKSNAHIHVQLIDDEAGLTLVSTSTLASDFRQSEFNKRNKSSAKQIGLKIAELAKSKNLTKAVFDRGPFKYHGVIAAVADGAREGGLEL